LFREKEYPYLKKALKLLEPENFKSLVLFFIKTRNKTELMKLVFGKEFVLEFNYKQSRILIPIRDLSDIEVVIEIFVKEMYRMSHSEEKRLVLDLGGHIGLFALYCNFHWPNASILSYEPAVDNYGQFLKTIDLNNKADSIKVSNKGIAKESGERFLALKARSCDHSIYSNELEDKGTRIEVLAFQELLNTHGKIDYVKMDIEGAEYEILNNLSKDSLGLIDALNLEVHPMQKYGYEIEDLVNRLRSNFKYMEKESMVYWFYNKKL
jgi:FkbM family methyltransferase